MKTVTASEARRHWFQLLDEAAAGHVIAIDRNGTKLVLRSDKRRKAKATTRKFLSGDDIENADRWGWAWDSAGKLVPVTRK